jgi:hypothetical protein
MDNERFDALIRALGNGATRRGALGLLAGAAGLALGEAEARRRNRRGSRANVPVGKVTICHHDQDTDTWHPITISANALDAHAKHGDFQYDVAQGQCCTNADCGASGKCTITVDGAGTGSGTCGCPVASVCNSVQSCGSGSGCVCASTADAGNACVLNSCAGACSSCSSSSECLAGQVCVTNTCLGSVCANVCSDRAAARASRGGESRRLFGAAG